MPFSFVVLASMALSFEVAQAQGLEFNPYEPSLAPIAPSAAPVVHWETNVLDAFVKAIEQNRPLIVLFTEPADSVNRQAVEEARQARSILGSEVLGSYGDRAFFVTCELKQLGSVGSDEYGLRLAGRLGVSISPTLVVVAPNQYDLTCTFSSIGTNADTLKKELNAVLVRAVSPEVTWNPPSPTYAVDQLADAMKRGQLHRMRASYDSSFAEALRVQIELGVQIFNAKQRLQESVSTYFGAPIEPFNEISDSQRLKTAVRRFVDHEVLEVTTSGDVTQVRVRWTVRDGQTVQDFYETFRTVRENNGYRLVSATQADDIAQSEAWVRKNQSVPALLEKVRVDVQHGRYSTTAEAREAALRAVLAPDAPVGVNSPGATR